MLRWSLPLLALGLVACDDDVTPNLDADITDTRSDTDTDTDTHSDTDSDTSSDSDTDGEVDSDTDIGTDTTEPTPPTPREPGERAPLTARCAADDPSYCFSPWPSSAFLVKDDESPTGVRIQIELDELLSDESAEDLLTMNGFSRVTPIVNAIAPNLNVQDFTIRAFIAEPGPDYGREIALRYERYSGRTPNDPHPLLAFPLAPLPEKSEILVIVEALSDEAYASFGVTRLTQVALGTEASTEEEAKLAAYHAPARKLIEDLDLDASKVVRLWDFVTRSADEPRQALAVSKAAIRQAIDNNEIQVEFTRLRGENGNIAQIVEGKLHNLPDPYAPEGGEGIYSPRYSVPFRLVVPKGEGNYRIALFGHGAGGSVNDSAFDQLVTGSNAIKVNVEIDGWTESNIMETVSTLSVPLSGSRTLATRMRRSIAGIAAIQYAVEGFLGELLGAETLMGQPNPTAGRFPNTDKPIWTGGSLGGTIGAVYGNLEESIEGGILNVPGAGFTHWLTQSIFSELLNLMLESRYPAHVSQHVATAMMQNYVDDVDGALWAGYRTVAPLFLVQLSVGDPVMPNVGSSMVAASLNALQLVPPGKEPILGLAPLERAEVAYGRSALTEYLVAETGNYAIHGFADRNGEGGYAARAQITSFIESLWAGEPVITIPDACYETANPGICDFKTPVE